MFSLVMPTFNRAPILARTLTHLFALESIAECEVIVIDDGSTDETPKLLYRMQRAQSNLKVIHLSNGGPARARNAGVKAATRERILFIDDDVFPRAGMLQHHARLLDDGYTASQGILVWHPDIEITPLIQYIDSRGSQFAFDQVEDASRLSFAHIYTGNCAMVRKTILDAGGFDETFFEKRLAFSAFEDTILGFQLENQGAKLALNRDALADHLHDMNEESYLRREYKVGYNIGKLQQQYPRIAAGLGLANKGRRFAGGQYRVLQAMNGSVLAQLVPGYSMRMRLRHREAFFCGFLQFQQEQAAAPGDGA